MKSDEFTAAVARRLAERAGHICGNPDCNCLTAGPSEKDPELSTRKGRACHICAASSGGPRYDQNQTPAERKSAANGLWLCANCGDIIDKNNGIDFPVNVLHMWKEKHENMIRTLIKSNASPLALARKNTHESQVAQQLVDYMEGKGAFYVPACYENHIHVVDSLTEVRNEIKEKLSQIPVGEKLYGLLKSVRDACQDYMNDTSKETLPMDIEASLAVMRKKVGIVLKAMQEQYGVNIEGRIAGIMPSLRG